MNTFKQFYRKQLNEKLLLPVANIRKQGFSSETLAFSVSIGIIGGAFPVIGMASYVCFILTLALKQNIVIAQVANWLSYPLQLMLMIPLMKLGNSFLGNTHLGITLNQVVLAFKAGLLNGFREVGLFSLYGIAAWVTMAIPCMFVLYLLLLVLFRSMKKLRTNAPSLTPFPCVSKTSAIRPVTTPVVVDSFPENNDGLKAS